MTAIARLRAATATAHEAVEAGFDWQDCMSTLARYRDTLALLYGFHVAWEDRAAAVLRDPGLFDPRRRAPLLADDLRHLGLSGDVLARLPIARVPPLHGPAAALGSMYVVEGSTLGGRVMARHIAATLGLEPGGGLSFHTGHGGASGSMWRAFCMRVDAGLTTGPELDEAVEAALATFACLGDWLSDGSGCAPDTRLVDGGGIQRQQAGAVQG